MSANFPNPPEFPSCTGPEGILYDFNYGARVLLPEGKWHVILMDDDSGNILFSCDSEGGWVTSIKNITSASAFRYSTRIGEPDPR